MRHRVLALALLLTSEPSEAWRLSSSPPGRHGTARLCATESPPTDGGLPVLELKEELSDLLDDIADRGFGARQEDADDVMEIVEELEPLNPCAEWASAPELAGKWRLRYTSSKTFENNQGLTGYARDIGGVNTPELLMSIQTDYKIVTYEEPLQLEGGSLAAMLGGFAGASSIKAECVWQPSRDGVFLGAGTITLKLCSRSLPNGTSQLSPP